MKIDLGYLISPEFLVGTDLNAAIKDQQLIVQTCRELGMSAVFSAEHLSRQESVWFPPLMLLSRVCEYGEGMMFGTAVLAAGLHNPVALAEQVGFLDAATGGKFVLGLASGWNRSEFESMGVSMSTRGKALDETIDILRGLWGSSDPFSYSGDVYQLKDVTMSFRPSRGIDQPIWLGASSDVALRRAAAVGDTWIISSHMSPEHAEQQATTYRGLLESTGRPFPTVLPGLRSVFVAPTMEAAKSTGGDQLTASYEMFKNWGLFQDVFDQKLDTVKYEDVTQRAIIGSPEVVAEGIVDFVRRTGVNLLTVRSQWLGMSAQTIIGSLELLCSQVLPLVNAELGN
jgi:alkanesulfonate monooxygenase SsuD/methylene tetrahydromethanopterin reductase-like flavin-dependent oxidoreductase (luciferase family)